MLFNFKWAIASFYLKSLRIKFVQFVRNGINKCFSTGTIDQTKTADNKNLISNWRCVLLKTTIIVANETFYIM